jgi:CBS domain/BON domain
LGLWSCWPSAASMPGPTVDSVMTTTVITVRPETPFKQIVELLEANQISAVPVVHPDGTPLGVVSEADLLAKEEYAGGTEPVRLFAGAGRRQRWRKVNNGVVTLDGRFERRSEAEIAVKLTTAWPGVVGVIDKLAFEWDDITAAKSTGL